ncbi:MAG TPA: aldolase/citrate lyase family protein [Vicinamibacterales bacterium]|nr:aldolase/citrate lyase family protein [Vicinamibacterales bacterium]
MRKQIVLGVVALAAFGLSAGAQSRPHLNPMVDLLAAKQAVFGLGLPSARGGGPGRRGGSAGGDAQPAQPPAPPKTPLELAKDAIAHPEADYFFFGGMERGVDNALPNFTAMMDAIVEAGGVSKQPPRLLVPVNVKAPNISAADRPADPAKYVSDISKQLNAGVSSISFVEVDSAEELRQGIAAMRFKSKGGTRPEEIGSAAKYWGLTDAEYRRRADVWPLNPEGELVVWAIIETKEGLENVREIAQVPGLGVLVPGAGTLGGIFSTTGPDGRRVRDDAAWEAAIQKVLSACKEFKVPCGYPVNENDIETRMQQGFTVAILQAFNDPAFRAVEKGRVLSGRAKK